MNTTAARPIKKRVLKGRERIHLAGWVQRSWAWVLEHKPSQAELVARYNREGTEARPEDFDPITVGNLRGVLRDLGRSWPDSPARRTERRAAQLGQRIRQADDRIYRLEQRVDELQQALAEHQRRELAAPGDCNCCEAADPAAMQVEISGGGPDKPR